MTGLQIPFHDSSDGLQFCIAGFDGGSDGGDSEADQQADFEDILEGLDAQAWLDAEEEGGSDEDQPQTDTAPGGTARAARRGSAAWFRARKNEPLFSGAQHVSVW